MEPSDVETGKDLYSHRHPASTRDNPTAVTCITGMHRSGTSLVARLLHECGMALGPERELKKPAADNLDGYFENRKFVRLNENIITQFGGRWNHPPSFPPGWELTPEASQFLEPAKNLVSQFRHDNWGWKDPRTSLTLPFWRRLIPDLKVVVCIRNPIEVSRSLFLRGDTKSPSHFELWLAYYSQLLSATSPSNRLVTHYQSYFKDARAELRRVLNWLDVDVSDETVERACTHISADLRHHYVMTAESIGTNVPDEILSSYLDLCAEAGPIYQQARQHEASNGAALAVGRANELSAVLKELQHTRASGETRRQLLNEILNSKAFKLVSLYWRLRRRK
ncbi:MAG: sulfotransferase [bacterium]